MAIGNRDGGPWNEAYDESMSYISERLSSLRQEIASLRDMNTHYAEESQHSQADQTTLDLRTSRLQEIKRELSNMLSHPDDSAVWWDKFHKPNRAA